MYSAWNDEWLSQPSHCRSAPQMHLNIPRISLDQWGQQQRLTGLTISRGAARASLLGCDSQEIWPSLVLLEWGSLHVNSGGATQDLLNPHVARARSGSSRRMHHLGREPVARARTMHTVFRVMANRTRDGSYQVAAATLVVGHAISPP